MKWRNHRLVTAAGVFFLGGGHVLPTLAAYLGSTFPDRVEGRAYGRKIMAHRRHSHWWAYYVAAMLACHLLLLGGRWTLDVPMPSASALMGAADTALLVQLAAYCAQWFCVGALAHMAEDFFCGGVPLLSPYRRWGVRLFRVGTWREHAIAWGVVAACYYCRTIESFESIRLL